MATWPFLTGSVNEFLDGALIVVAIMIIWYIIKFFLVAPPTKEEKDARALEDAEKRKKFIQWIKDRTNRSEREHVYPKPNNNPDQPSEQLTPTTETRSENSGEPSTPAEDAATKRTSDQIERVSAQEERTRQDLNDILIRLEALESSLKEKFDGLLERLKKLGQGFKLKETEKTEILRELERIRQDIKSETRDVIDSKIRELVHDIEKLRQEILEVRTDIRRESTIKESNSAERESLIREIREVSEKIKSSEKEIMSLREKLSESMERISEKIERIEREKISKETVKELVREIKEIKESTTVIEKGKGGLENITINVNIAGVGGELLAKAEAVAKAEAKATATGSKGKSGRKKSGSVPVALFTAYLHGKQLTSSITDYTYNSGPAEIKVENEGDPASYLNVRIKADKYLSISEDKRILRGKTFFTFEVRVEEKDLKHVAGNTKTLTIIGKQGKSHNKLSFAQLFRKKPTSKVIVHFNFPRIVKPLPEGTEDFSKTTLCRKS